MNQAGKYLVWGVIALMGACALVINYDDKSWQQLLTQLGEITGVYHYSLTLQKHFTSFCLTKSLNHDPGGVFFWSDRLK